MTNDAGHKILKRCFWTGIFIFSLLTIGLVLDFFNYSQTARSSAPCANRGENGIWLRYHWYFDKKNEVDAVETIERIKENQIKFAYFHVLDVKPDGDLRQKRLSSARKLIGRFHRDLPQVKIIAWVSAGDWYPAHGTDLARAQVIENMVASAKWLAVDCGFDGVQWDYEPAPDNSPNFLKLLELSKKAMPPDKILSVASPMAYPENIKTGWSAAYFGRVSEYCDQIAVMGYDSGFYYPRAYEWLMNQQIILIIPAIARINPNCKLLIGVPTYDRNFLHDHSETLKLGLIGVRNGLAQTKSDEKIFAGVAPFADYTTDQVEWQTFKDLWLCPG